MIGLHSPQAGLDVPKEVLSRPHVAGRSSLPVAGDGAPALGRQIEVLAAMAGEPTDEFLARAVVVGRVEEVDADVQHGVEDLLRLPAGQLPAAPSVLAADVHRAVPQRSDFQACSPQETPAQHDRHARGALSPRRPGRRAPVTGSLESVNRSRAARGRHERQSRLSVRLVPSRHGSLVDV